MFFAAASLRLQGLLQGSGSVKAETEAARAWAAVESIWEARRVSPMQRNRADESPMIYFLIDFIARALGASRSRASIAPIADNRAALPIFQYGKN
jgi:hypothetical protein